MKIKDNKPLDPASHSVRRSQAVLQYGVGALGYGYPFCAFSPLVFLPEVQKVQTNRRVAKSICAEDEAAGRDKRYLYA